MRPRALLVTPVFPSATGNGLAMRAGNWLEILTKHYEVNLFVVPIYPSHSSAPEFAKALANSIKVAELGPGENSKVGLTQASLAKLAEAQIASDLVLIFRLILAELVSPAADAIKVLDLDDFDWVRERSLGNSALAESLELKARLVIGEFDLITAANQGEYERVGQTHKFKNFQQVSNVVRPPQEVDSLESIPEIDLLFVGTLGYEPNIQGLKWFKDNVLERLSPDVRVGIVGANPPLELTNLEDKRLLVFPNVDSVTPYYQKAKVAIVPLLSGSGTRTKIIEAWAHGIPVVSTSFGADGIDVDGSGLVANTPGQFAKACLSLLSDPRLRKEIGTQATHSWSIHHSIDVASKQFQSGLGKIQGRAE